MRFDPTLVVIVVVVAAVALVALFIWTGIRRRRSHQLRDRFGPEYAHAVEDAGSRRTAERELLEREKHAVDLEIHPLSMDQKQRFRSEWETIEGRFVERPTTAVVEADEMMQDVLRHKGFPVRSFDGLLSDLSVHDPDLAEDFRAAHEIIDREDPSALTTEDLRQAMLHFRTMFDELVGPVPTSRAGARDVEQPIETASELESENALEDRPRLRRDRSDEKRPRLR